MNSLKGGVKIETFDLPSNDPDGGIHLTLQTNVTNVSSRVARVHACIEHILTNCDIALASRRRAHLDRVPEFLPERPHWPCLRFEHF